MVQSYTAFALHEIYAPLFVFQHRKCREKWKQNIQRTKPHMPKMQQQQMTAKNETKFELREQRRNKKNRHA